MRFYRQMSGHQERYVAFVRANPGCSVADVERACKANPQAGHKWVYDGVGRLIRQGVLRSARGAGNRCALFVTDAAEALLAQVPR